MSFFEKRLGRPNEILIYTGERNLILASILRPEIGPNSTDCQHKHVFIIVTPSSVSVKAPPPHNSVSIIDSVANDKIAISQPTFMLSYYCAVFVGTMVDYCESHYLVLCVSNYWSNKKYNDGFVIIL